MTNKNDATVHADVTISGGCDTYLDAMMGTTDNPEAPGGGHSIASSINHIPLKKTGFFGTSSNLVNSIVGAGIIGIPCALRQSGLIAGILLLLLVACLTGKVLMIVYANSLPRTLLTKLTRPRCYRHDADKSLRMIVELASFHPLLNDRELHSFEDLMAYPFGVPGSRFVLLNMFVIAYGPMVAYLLIIKDTIPTILGLADGAEGGMVRELIMMATSITIILPLAMQRDMASLAFTSLLSVSADVVLVIFVAAVAPIEESVTAAGGLVQVLKNDVIRPSLFSGIGILSTTFAAQHSAFIVSGSLHDKTSSRWSRVTCVSLNVAAFMCLTLGITGYLGFLEETEGAVLNNFHANVVEANVARGLLAFTMFFTYPMECFVARHVLVKLLFQGDLDGPIDENGKPLAVFCCMTRRHMITIAIYVLTLIPALIVNDLGPVLSITGALGGSCLCYIAPGVVYL
jgi:solute carrier family 38 (sodium-coupled neutral amino acid transporter), member 11